MRGEAGWLDALADGAAGPDPRVQAYLRSRRLFNAGVTLARAVFDGVWLGLLDRPQCAAVDRWYYDGQPAYVDPAYNQRGLWAWERDDVDAHFRACGRIAVLGAGGGREVVALRGEGFDVDGFECHEGLRAAGNQLLQSLGLPPTMFSMPRDRWPRSRGDDCGYDGVVVGWGTYMLIQDRDDRIELLRAVRARLSDGGPVLVSFFVRDENARSYRVSAGVANALRRARRREAVDEGASLVPNRVQFLTVAEVAEELREAGFALGRAGTGEYGHAVGLAVPERPQEPG